MSSCERCCNVFSLLGSATALFSAIKHPERVRALIMVRPPTAWESRLARRPNLLNSAARLDQSGSYHLVLRGAAYSDLPHLERDVDLYKKITCPVLILTIKGDGAHPVRYNGRTQLHILSLPY